MKKLNTQSVIQLKLVDRNLTLEQAMSDEDILNYVGRKVYIIYAGDSHEESNPISCSSNRHTQQYDYKQLKAGNGAGEFKYTALIEYTLLGVNNQNQLVLSREFKTLHLFTA